VETIINSIAVSLLVSASSLFMHRKSTDFHIWILYPANLLKVLIWFEFFQVNSWVTKYRITSHLLITYLINIDHINNCSLLNSLFVSSCVTFGGSCVPRNLSISSRLFSLLGYKFPKFYWWSSGFQRYVLWCHFSCLYFINFDLVFHSFIYFGKGVACLVYHSKPNSLFIKPFYCSFSLCFVHFSSDFINAFLILTLEFGLYWISKTMRSIIR
jgi:hypothetical protein